MSHMPGFRAEESLYRTSAHYAMGTAGMTLSGAASVQPQLCASTGCLTVGGGRICVNLPILGRQCVNIPSIGSWRIRCCTRWGWPPVSCSVQSCV